MALRRGRVSDGITDGRCLIEMRAAVTRGNYNTGLERLVFIVVACPPPT